MQQQIESLLDRLILCNKLEIRSLITWNPTRLKIIQRKKVEYKRKLRVVLGMDNPSRKQALESLFSRFD